MVSGVCVVSLNSIDGRLEAVSDNVLDDLVVICRRCTGLLKDFEHHERTAARIAEDIRRFLMRQFEAEEEVEEEEEVVSVPSKPQKNTPARNYDERQGIIAAFRAFRKAGVVERRGKKRKKDQTSPETIKEEDDDDEKSFDGSENEETEEEERQHETATARHSKRIQRRREDGLVIKWGDALYQNDDGARSVNDDDLFDHSSKVILKDRSYVRRRRRGRGLGRIVKSTSTSRTEDEMGFKFQCPFCFRYYTPMSSRIHSCTSYKNQLRCRTCNIFFTSYFRLERHLEVIHLKHKQLACPTEDCTFTCVAEPTLTIHKHFHVLESFDTETNKESGLRQQRETQKGVKHKEVIVEEDEHTAVTSPRIADRVSFLLDEKSFLSDGHPLYITTDKVPKDEQDDCKVLRFQDDGKNQEDPSSPCSGLEICTLSPDKDDCETYKGRNLVLQCPLCEEMLVSTKSYQEHMREAHQLRVLTKGIGEDRSIKESHKMPCSESLTRIVKKYYSVKKNSNAAPKCVD